jgi:hypothetical protein
VGLILFNPKEMAFLSIIIFSSFSKEFCEFDNLFFRLELGKLVRSSFFGLIELILSLFELNL